MDSLPLFHSWPLYDAATRMGLAGDHGDGADLLPLLQARSSRSVGIWSCDLRDDSLSWSPAVHALFGLPEDEPVMRDFAVSRYLPRSRTVMESLRAHAIEHRRGFTMDALIVRENGDKRWMRLSAAPILSRGKAVRLAGTKQDVTADYDGPDWQQL